MSLDLTFFTVIPPLETMVFFRPADLHQHFGAPSDQVRSAYGPASEKEGSHCHPFLLTGLGLPMQISLPSPHRPSLHTKGVCKNPAFMKPQKASSLHSLRARGAYLTCIPINNGYHEGYPSLNGRDLFQGEALNPPKPRGGPAAWHSLTYGYIVI